MLGSDLVHINFEQMKSRKNHHKIADQDRLVQNSTAVQYNTIDRIDSKSNQLKQ